MKKGLSYISERTDQLRYSDNATNEQWLQQLSTYMPLQAIRRGEAVSIATEADLEDVAAKVATDSGLDIYAAVLKKLQDSSDTYIVQTNPSRHTSTVGLSLEYFDGTIFSKVSESEITFSNIPLLHILGTGKYVEDIDYTTQAEVPDAASVVSGKTVIENTEYVPSFFKDYTSYIGKKIYVSATPNANGYYGQLTTSKEEAYLAYNNIIVVGFVADAYSTSDTATDKRVGAIEVQIEGDDRGALDSTLLEGTIADDFTVTKEHPTKVFAVGCEDDASFSFDFKFMPTDADLPAGFIGIQRIDGKTEIIRFGSTSKTSTSYWNKNNTTEDNAFLAAAQYFAEYSENKQDTDTGLYEQSLEGTIFTATSAATIGSQYTDIVAAIQKAMKDVAFDGTITSLKDSSTYANITTLTISDKSVSTVGASATLTADAVGGNYDIYISSNIKKYFPGLSVTSHGSYYNKGYAVLADIRNKDRQNILGIYISQNGYNETVARGTKAVFMKQGMFEVPSEVFNIGAVYYLSSHGGILTVPQEYYNSIVKVGVAQTATKLLVDLTDARQYNNGDLPVGYMKPSVNGAAEYGFLLMDGTTYYKVSEYETLYTRLQSFYDSTNDLKYNASYNFGTTEDEDIAAGFLLPKVVYYKSFADGVDTEIPAQIKAVAEGVYKSLPFIPFIRKTVELGGTKDLCTIPAIDVTDLVIYGPDEDYINEPALEKVDIKIFAQLDENTNKWTQLDPGFDLYNNTVFYGFKWDVQKTAEASANMPYGKWELHALYSPKGYVDGTGTDSDDTNGLGFAVQLDPYSPPVSLFGKKARVVITRKETFARQFDIGDILSDQIKSSVTDTDGTPWAGNAISGQAERDDIYAGVHTKKLTLGDGTVADDGTITSDYNSTVSGFISALKLYSANIDEEINNKANVIKANFRLASPNTTSLNSLPLDYFSGLLSYYDSTKANQTTLENAIAASDYNLMTYGIYNKHKSSLITAASDASDYTSYPHGISNNGYFGNLNAKAIQGVNLGTPGYVFNRNTDTVSSEELPFSATTKRLIPYLESASADTAKPYYQIRFGTKVLYDAISTTDMTNLLEQDISTSGITSTFKPADTSVTTKVLDYIYDSKTLRQTLDFGNSTFNFTDGTGTPVNIVAAALNSGSSKIYKYVLQEFYNTNHSGDPEITTYSGTDLSATTYGEALQAVYELPLAEFHYKSEDYNLKNYFGIITERVASVKSKFKDSYAASTTLGDETSYDKLAYTYTADEAASIENYLNNVTDNKDMAQNMLSSVGILFAAAKETQKRLLDLEVSTYGKDSPTLPGDVATDKVSTEGAKLTQGTTTYGLNRLVKALCREVFETDDPTNILINGDYTNDSLSRVDQLDAEINGADAAGSDTDDTTNVTYDLTSAAGVSYPTAITVDEDSYTTTKDNMGSASGDADTNYPAKAYVNGTTIKTDALTERNFDGLNDAVNRIVLKLNQLTSSVNGSDNITYEPSRLNLIRSNIETIIKDIYYDDYTDDGSKAYVKNNYSRIDALLNTLYNFNLSVDTTQTWTGTVTDSTNKWYKSTSAALAKTFNGKLLQYTADTTNEDGSVKTATSRAPQTISDYSYATIIDILVDMLGGTNSKLIRTSTDPTFSDFTVNANGTKATKSDAELTSAIANNKTHFLTSTVLSRLDVIEKALELLSLKAQNKLDFTALTSSNLSENAFTGVSSIDDFMNFISGMTGFKFNKTGFYATRDSSISAESLTKANTSTVSATDGADTLDEYNILYDLTKRLKVAEAENAVTKAQIGSDYAETVAVDDTLTNPVYGDSGTTATADHTVTSDVSSILKLLYGEDNSASTGTTYEHFTTTSMATESFVKSPATSKASALEAIYDELYWMPIRKTVVTTTVTTAEATEANDKLASTYYDIKSTFIKPADMGTGDVLLGGGGRARFIPGQTSRKNRFDAIESIIKAAYNYIDLGSESNPGFYTGTMNVVANTAANTATVNGSTQLTTGTVTEISGSWTLTKAAMQAYYNTLALNSKKQNVLTLTDTTDGTTAGKALTLVSGLLTLDESKLVAGKASVLTTSDVGGAIIPTYFANGIPVACTPYAEASVATAATWKTARTFTVKDQANTTLSVGSTDRQHSGDAASVNGSANVDLILPSTINADILGNATTATKATQDSDGHTISAYYQHLLTAGDHIKIANSTDGAETTISSDYPSIATAAAAGLVRFGYSGTTAKRYGVQITTDGDAYVDVPWAENDNSKYMPLEGGTFTGAIATQNIAPSDTDKYSIGTSDNVYAAMYATMFHGKLTGNVTGDVSGATGVFTTSVTSALFSTTNELITLNETGGLIIKNSTGTLASITAAGAAAFASLSVTGAATVGGTMNIYSLNIGNGTDNKATITADGDITGKIITADTKFVKASTFATDSTVAATAFTATHQTNMTTADAAKDNTSVKYDVDITADKVHLQQENYNDDKALDSTTIKETVITAAYIETPQITTTDLTATIANLNGTVGTVKGNVATLTGNVTGSVSGTIGSAGTVKSATTVENADTVTTATTVTAGTVMSIPTSAPNSPVAGNIWIA